MPNYKKSVTVNHQIVESMLEKRITEMIARDLKVEPEEITPEFIHKWREDHLYPVAHIDLTTLYGGYNGAGRRVFTGNELKICQEKAEAFISKF